MTDTTADVRELAREIVALFLWSVDPADTERNHPVYVGRASQLLAALTKQGIGLCGPGQVAVSADIHRWACDELEAFDGAGYLSD